ncbi:MAG: hypothetical protein CK425_09625 [Parachlamydia sp.]|nr:MAG: hypothetical protein CK425_09625 [Parachlamydia sp.]
MSEKNSHCLIFFTPYSVALQSTVFRRKLAITALFLLVETLQNQLIHNDCDLKSSSFLLA